MRDTPDDLQHSLLPLRRMVSHRAFMGARMTRKIIQIATDPPDGLCALCDDGTVWAIQDAGTRWRQMAPIPQPEDDPLEVESVRPQASWLPWQHSLDRMWCVDAADESATEVPGPGQFVRWCDVAEECGWTMARGFNVPDALRTWRLRGNPLEVIAETLTIDGTTFTYIESAIPF